MSLHDHYCLVFLLCDWLHICIGDQELENGHVAVRDRKQGDIGVMSLEEFKEKIAAEKASRSL